MRKPTHKSPGLSSRIRRKVATDTNHGIVRERNRRRERALIEEAEEAKLLLEHAKVALSSPDDYRRPIGNPDVGGAIETTPKAQFERAAQALLRNIEGLPIDAIEDINRYATKVRDRVQFATITESGVSDAFNDEDASATPESGNLSWPTERFDPNRHADVLVFIRKYWSPLLRSGLAGIEDLERNDERAFNAIVWPTAKYSELGKAKDLQSALTDYLKPWTSLIDLGLVDLNFLRSRDPSAADAISNLKASGRSLPEQLHLRTKKERNADGIRASIMHGIPLTARLKAAFHRQEKKRNADLSV